MITGQNYHKEQHGRSARIAEWGRHAEMELHAHVAPGTKTPLLQRARNRPTTGRISAIMLKALGIVLFLWTYVVSTRSIATKDTACSDLKGDVKYAVDSKVIDAGALNITDVNGSNNFTFCRVFGRMPYSKNDTINFEVWLPTSSKYNDRYLSVGAYCARTPFCT